MYEIYNPITKEQLNLSYCEEILIKLNIPVNIDKSKLFKYNPNSEYYTDSCSSYTTDDGTDILINDRKKEYETNHLSLCENNCKYIEYNEVNKESVCDCGVKNKMENISDIANNPNKLSNQFSTNTSSSSNIISIKCTKTLFTKDGLKNNISSYVLLIIIFYFLLSTALFIKCGYALLMMEINKIIKHKEKEENKIKKQLTNGLKASKRSRIQKISMPPTKRVNFNKINNNKITLKKRYHRVPGTNSYLMKMFGFNTITVANNVEEKIEKEKNIINNNNNNIIIKKEKIKTMEKVPESKIIKNDKPFLNDYELNVLDYKDAIRYDKRTCFEYYIILLRMKHPILFGLCPFKDYNTMIIKSCILFLSFAIYYAINFVFFTEDTIHKIYEDQGKFDIIYFIPQISISFAISHIITIIIKLIFLSERNIALINLEQKSADAYTVSEKEKRNLVIKHTFFFILGFIFLGVFWLFLSAFGAVYQNTQIVVFENTLISFGISLVLPFFINVVPAGLRISSLSSENQSSGCIYNFSKFIQII